LEWFNQARTLNLSVNGNIVTEKAHEIAKRLHIDEFSGSGGWIDRFKKGMILYIDKFVVKQSLLMTLISLHGVKIFCRIF